MKTLQFFHKKLWSTTQFIPYEKKHGSTTGYNRSPLDGFIHTNTGTGGGGGGLTVIARLRGNENVPSSRSGTANARRCCHSIYSVFLPSVSLVSHVYAPTGTSLRGRNMLIAQNLLNGRHPRPRARLYTYCCGCRTRRTTSMYTRSRFVTIRSLGTLLLLL